jgi:hypothetical protein
LACAQSLAGIRLGLVSCRDGRVSIYFRNNCFARGWNDEVFKVSSDHFFAVDFARVVDNPFSDPMVAQ